jgi:hypothetical protein
MPCLSAVRRAARPAQRDVIAALTQRGECPMCPARPGRSRPRRLRQPAGGSESASSASPRSIRSSALPPEASAISPGSPTDSAWRTAWVTAFSASS